LEPGFASFDAAATAIPPLAVAPISFTGATLRGWLMP
jgi:hypothetical protein